MRSSGLLCVAAGRWLSSAIGSWPSGDAETSASSPDLSFQRQDSGIVSSAPAAAAKSAASNQAFAATCPQTALPNVTDPNITVKKMARPRPRTQSGNAICADT